MLLAGSLILLALFTLTLAPPPPPPMHLLTPTERPTTIQLNPTRKTVEVQNSALLVDLTAQLITAGAPLPRALEHLSSITPTHLSTPLARVTTALASGTDWHTSWAALSQPWPVPLQHLERALRFSAITAAPSATHLAAEAARIRKRRLRRLHEHAAGLGVKLLLPMGLCSLPAFLLWTVTPIVIGLLPP